MTTTIKTEKLADIQGKIITSTITRTCCACPSQWEGMLTDGNMMYGRFRGGYFRVEVSTQPVKDVSELFDYSLDVLEGDDGGSFDGYMTDAEFTYHLTKNNLLNVSKLKRLWILSTWKIYDRLEDRAFSRSLSRGVKNLSKVLERWKK